MAGVSGWPRSSVPMARGAMSRARSIFCILPEVYHHPSSFILASASPRRAELLTRAGYRFDVVHPEVDERRYPDESPRDYVARLSLAKSAIVGAQCPERVVLGADTTVVVDSTVLGKPRDPDDAARMLRLLSGRSHDVLTGVAVRRGEAYVCDVETTVVYLTELDDASIAWYVETKEPSDKAGGYGVQGVASRFVTRIEGSYSNVVGLPLALFDRLFAQLDDAVEAPR